VAILAFESSLLCGFVVPRNFVSRKIQNSLVAVYIDEIFSVRKRQSTRLEAEY
jgi:hypothetical protein